MTYEILSEVFKDAYPEIDEPTEEDWEELASDHISAMIAERRTIILSDGETWLL